MTISKSRGNGLGTFGDSAGTLIAAQSTGSFSSDGDGAVCKTAYMAEGAYTFEATNTCGDGICCQYGAGRFKASVNDEPVAISSRSGESRESFDVVRRSISPTVDYRLDVAYDDYP
jgi:hypothetical protein